ncbi:MULTISPECIES: hybrid sensor histidine kinase/response regulator [Pseudomonas syringae group]|uniref:histidine kinase n=4 Tax=Pseudomonas syringae group TaxID=136849 RepID=A0AAD0E0C5_9PSED|nr:MULTISPECIES: PAS domain-containing sensor histidine kinase [Pseudomonas syringae group]AVB21296.1 PAS domain-containing sensor histidine kinase [Pseudomonas avellanae]EGH13369.1 sensory box histidine kinase/response regulator [Pseudomonas amygdali pv. morsprunorum str. M302280]KWS58053.1 hybrid sensor histidine kinase/response regulator [Pseudomonas amygdali pv. morsprunorum]PHN40632.1 histidine kinase [Pseudomonas avellanae]POC87926.1 hybrid sensor histidine kinase/response regulator [Pse
MSNDISGGRSFAPQVPRPSAHEAAERLQLALDSGAVAGTWVWDIIADQLTGDERFARTFGLCPKLCAKGLPLALVTASIHPDDALRVDKDIADALSNGETYRCEYRVLHHDGVYRWVEASGRIERDAQGKPIRSPGVLLDIDSRRTAEAERDRLNELLQIFTAAVPGVVYAKDLEGKMLVANRGTAELIGKPPEFFIGKTDLEFLDDEEQARVLMETDRRIMQNSISEQIEEKVNLADGSAAVWLSTKAPLLDRNGDVIGLIGSSIDVTARKKAEEAVSELNQTLEQRIEQAVFEREQIEDALRHSQKMDAVGQLTGGIAHDFNNLLAGISGSLELITKRLDQGRVSDVDRYVSVAQGAVRRAASLTHRLLAFSRRQTLSPRVTDVNVLIHDMEEMIARTVGPEIDIKVVAQNDLWPALIDHAQLESSLLNLCLNARDAMPNGGHIIIETANASLAECNDPDHGIPAGEHLSIRITDTGSGMSPAIVTKAFEPFFTTKPIGAGTGLGLSMVYGFVRQSGGQIRVESVEGQGTSVVMHLPRHTSESTPRAAEPEVVEEPAHHTGETVLIVDDEPSVRMLVAEVITGLGLNCLEAADAQSGLQILQSDARIDLLISDIGLPGGMNGREMADAAGDCRPGLPTLFITGYAKSSVLDDCHLRPCTQVLTKPFGLDALAGRVTGLIGADAVARGYQ